MRRPSLLAACAAVALLAACGPVAPDSGAGSASRSAADAPAAKVASRGPATPEALAALHLDKSGAGRVAFSASAEEGGAHVWRDVVIDTEDGEQVRAESLRVDGAHLEGEAPRFDRLTLTNASIADKEGALKVGSLTLIGPNAATAKLVARLLEGRDIEDGEDFGKPTDYAFETFAIENATFDVANPDSGETVQMAFGAIKLNRLDAGRLASFLFDGFTLTGDFVDETTGKTNAVAVRLGKLEMTGIDARLVDAAAAEAQANGKGEDAGAFQRAFADPFLKRYDGYSLTGFALDVAGFKVALPEAEGRANQTRGGVEYIDSYGPLTVTVSEEGEFGAQAKPFLAMMGYESGLEFSGRSRQIADPLQDRIHSQEWRVELRDGFVLEGGYDIGGVGEYVRRAAALSGAFDAGEAVEDPSALASLYEPLIINGVELKFTDNSIVSRGFKVASAMSGQPADQLQAQTAAMLAMGSAFAPEGPAKAVITKSVLALQNFLAEPGVLTLSLKPETPVKVADLVALESDPSAIEKLGFEIKAQPKNK